MSSSVPRAYKLWFLAAAVYNGLWSIIVTVFAERIIQACGLTGTLSSPFLQVIAMMVGVYAYGYWLLYRDPIRYANFVWIGLFGKLFGVFGDDVLRGDRSPALEDGTLCPYERPDLDSCLCPLCPPLCAEYSRLSSPCPTFKDLFERTG